MEKIKKEVYKILKKKVQINELLFNGKILIAVRYNDTEYLIFSDKQIKVKPD